MAEQNQMTDNDPTEQLLTDKDALRKKALQAYMNVGKTAEENVKSLDATQKAGSQAIRANLGQGLASAGFGAGRAGKAGYGAALQAGGTGAGMESGLIADIAKQKAAAKMQAATAQTEGLESVAKMGTNIENKRKAMQGADAEINRIIEANKGFFNDDEATMASQIKALVGRYADQPEVQKYLMSRAGGIQSGSEDV